MSSGRGMRVAVLAMALWGVLGGLSGVSPGMSAAWGVELEQTIWGFGEIPPGEDFLPVSVLLRNDALEAFEGKVQLMPSGGQMALGGTVLEEDVFIAPNSSRWVQFFPYRSTYQGEWVLLCGRTERFDLPSARNQVNYGDIARKPMVAWLQGEGLQAAGQGAFPRFPAELFPVSVTGTDGLHVAVLNEAPRWDQPRRESFLQWVQRGGAVHLYQGVDGALPVFTGELEVLNGKEPRTKIGQGEVVRHEQSISGAKLADVVPSPVTSDQPVQMNNMNYRYFSYGNDAIFRRLRELVAPQHQWPLIWLASGVYLLVIFPGGYLVGKSRRDFRLVMGLQVGAALLFTLLFSVIGARGYGESARNLSVGAARSLGNGKWELSAWNNVFATSGGDYTISLPKGGLFGTGMEQGASLRGVINNGGDGKYLVDIPPFSSCTFVTRSVVEHPSVGVQVAAWEAGNPRSIECQVTGWPEGTKRAFLYVGGEMYSMKYDGGGRLKADFPVSQDHQTAPWRQTPHVPGEGKDPQAWMEEQMEEQEESVAWSAVMGRVRLGEPLERRGIVLIPAKMPETFFPQVGITGGGTGRVLYCLDIVPPGS